MKKPLIIDKNKVDAQQILKMNQELANVVKIYSTGSHKELSNCLIEKSYIHWRNLFQCETKAQNINSVLETPRQNLNICPTIYLQFDRVNIWLKQKQFQIDYLKGCAKNG